MSNNLPIQKTNMPTLQEIQDAARRIHEDDYPQVSIHEHFALLFKDSQIVAAAELSAIRLDKNSVREKIQSAIHYLSNYCDDIGDFPYLVTEAAGELNWALEFLKEKPVEKDIEKPSCGREICPPTSNCRICR